MRSERLRAEAANQQAEQERIRAEEADQRAERYAAILKSMGVAVAEIDNSQQ